jgi:hypothetical protein
VAARSSCAWPARGINRRDEMTTRDADLNNMVATFFYLYLSLKYTFYLYKDSGTPLIPNPY